MATELDLNIHDLISASALGYLETDEEALYQVLNAIVSRIIPHGIRRYEYLQTAQSNIRKALGLSELPYHLMEVGGITHKMIDDALTGASGEDAQRIAIRKLANALARYHREDPNAFLEGNDAAKTIERHVVPESRVKDVLADKRARFRPDVLAFYKRGGKIHAYIIDAKAGGGGAAAEHTYYAQLDEYAALLKAAISGKEEGVGKYAPSREAILRLIPKQYRRELERNPSLLEVHTLVVGSKSLLDPRVEQPIAGRIAGTEHINARKRLERAAGALQNAVGGSDKLGKFVEDLSFGHVTRTTRNAIDVAKTMVSTGSVQPTQRVSVVVDPKKFPIEIDTSTRAVPYQPRADVTRVGIRLNIADRKADDADVFVATIDGKQHVFTDVDDLQKALLKGRYVEDIQFAAGVHNSPEKIIATLSTILSNVTRMGAGGDAFNIGDGPQNEILRRIVGTPIDSLDIGGGTTLSKGYRLDKQTYVSGIRMRGPSKGSVIVQVGTLGHYEVPIERKGSRWDLSELAVIGVSRPSALSGGRFRNVNSAMAVVRNRPDITLLDKIRLGARFYALGPEATVEGPGGAIVAYAQRRSGTQAARRIIEELSHAIEGVNPFIAAADPRFIFWPREEVEDITGKKSTAAERTTSRFLATDAEAFLRAAGIPRLASGKYWVGSQSEKAAIKAMKHLKKAGRPQERLVITGGGAANIPSSLSDIFKHGTAGTTGKSLFRLAILGTGAITQGQGFLILPKGAGGAFAVSETMRSFAVPPGFKMFKRIMSGERIRVDADGYITIGTRTEEIFDQKSGKYKTRELPVRMFVGKQLHEVSFFPGDKSASIFFSGAIGSDREKAKIILGMRAYTPQFTAKDAGIKAYLQTLTYEAAVDLFGEELVQSAIGDASLPTMLLGIDNMKLAPRFLRAMGDALGIPLTDESAEGIATWARAIMSADKTKIKQVGVPVYADSLAGILMSHAAGSGQGGELKVPLLTTQALLGVTPEWFSGKTELNLEEADFYRQLFPGFYEDMKRESKRGRYSKMSIIAAARMNAEKALGAGGSKLVLTEEMVAGAINDLRVKNKSITSGAIMRQLIKQIGEQDPSLVLRPVQLRGTSFMLPSLHALATMSTMDETGQEVDAISRLLGGILVSSAEGSGGFQTWEKGHAGSRDELVQAISDLAKTEGVYRGATRFTMPRTFMGAFHTWQGLPAGGVFVPPAALAKMLPGLARELRKARDDPEGMSAILRAAYEQLEGEPLAYFRRPITDPALAALPAYIVNPYKIKSMKGLLSMMEKDPLRRDITPYVSDILFEPASADVDFDTAAISLLRNLRFKELKGADEYSWIKSNYAVLEQYRTGGEQATRLAMGRGRVTYTEEMLQRMRNLGFIPGEVKTLSAAARYVLLRRAIVRGGDVGAQSIDELAKIATDDSRFRRAVELLASKPYSGSQIGAIQSDIGLLSSGAIDETEMRRMFEGALKIPATAADVQAASATLADLSRASLDIVRSKTTMGIAYNALRPLIGGYRNMLARGEFGSLGDQLNFEKAIAYVSQLYQKALDLTPLTKEEMQALELFKLRQGKRGYGYSDVFNISGGGWQSNVWRPDEMITRLLGMEQGAADIAREILRKYLYSPDKESLDAALRITSDPTRALGTYDMTFGPATARMKALLIEKLGEQVPDELRRLAENMTDLVLQPIWDLAATYVGVTSTASSAPVNIEDSVADILKDVPAFENPNLPGKLRLSLLSEEEQLMLRTFESATPSQIARIREELGIGKNVPSPGMTPAGFNDIVDKIAGPIQDLVDTVSTLIGGTGFVGGGGPQRILTLEFLNALAGVSGGGFEARRYTTTAIGKQLAPLLEYMGPSASATDITAAKRASRLIGLLGALNVEDEAFGWQSPEVAARLNEILPALIGTREAPGKAVLTYESLRGVAQGTMAMVNPRTASGFAEWKRVTTAMAEAVYNMPGMIERLEETGRTEQANILREFYGSFEQLGQQMERVLDSGVFQAQTGAAWALQTARTPEEFAQITGASPELAQRIWAGRPAGYTQSIAGIEGVTPEIEAQLGARAVQYAMENILPEVLGEEYGAAMRIAKGVLETEGITGKTPAGKLAEKYLGGVAQRAVMGNIPGDLIKPINDALTKLDQTANAIDPGEVERAFAEMRESTIRASREQTAYSNIVRQSYGVLKNAVTEMEDMARSFQEAPREVSQSERMRMQQLGGVVRNIQAAYNRAGEQAPPEVADLLSRYEQAATTVGIFGERTGPMSRLERAYQRGFGQELYFGLRLFRMFLEPLIQGGQAYHEYQQRMGAYQMMAGGEPDRYSLAVIRNMNQMQFTRARTGGYIMSGMNGMLGPGGMGGQGVADILGIGGPTVAAVLAGGMLGLPFPVSLAAATAVAGGLSIARLVGESKDVTASRNYITRMAQNRWDWDVAGLLALQRTAEGRVGTAGVYPGTIRQSDINRERQRILAEHARAATYGTPEQIAGMVFGPQGLDQYAEIRRAVSGGLSGQEYAQILSDVQASLGRYIVAGTEGMTPEARAAAIMKGWGEAGLRNIVDANIVGFGYDAGLQLARAVARAEGLKEGQSFEEAVGAALKRIYTGEFYQQAVRAGLGEDMAKQYVSYMSTLSATGQLPALGLEQFVPETITPTQEMVMGSSLGLIQQMAQMGYSIGQLPLMPEGQAPLAMGFGQQIAQLQMRLGGTLAPSEIIDQIGMSINEMTSIAADTGAISKSMQQTQRTLPDTIEQAVDRFAETATAGAGGTKLTRASFDSMRMLMQAMSGNLPAAMMINPEALPQTIQEMLPNLLPPVYTTGMNGMPIGALSAPGITGPEAKWWTGTTIQGPGGTDVHFPGFIETYLKQMGQGVSPALQNLLNNYNNIVQYATPSAAKNTFLDQMMMQARKMAGLEDFGGIQQAQMALVAENRNYQLKQLAIQQEALAEAQYYQPIQLAIRQRLFEISVQRQLTSIDQQIRRIQSNAERQRTQWQWQLEDLERNYGRTRTRIGWSREDVQYQMQANQLRYGWTMEDIQEALRYATGRERRQLLIQQERQTIEFSMGMGRGETQLGRLRQQEEWAEEDFERERERHDVRREWIEEEIGMSLDQAEQQKAFLLEEIELRRQQMDIEAKLSKSQLERRARSLAATQAHIKVVAGLQAQISSAQTATENLGLALHWWSRLMPGFVWGWGALYDKSIRWLQLLQIYGIGVPYEAPSERESMAEYCAKHPSLPECQNYYNPYLPGSIVSARITTGEASLLRQLEHMSATDVATVKTFTAMRTGVKTASAPPQTADVRIYDNPAVVGLLSKIAGALTTRGSLDKRVRLEIVTQDDRVSGDELVEALELTL